MNIQTCGIHKKSKSETDFEITNRDLPEMMSSNFAISHRCFPVNFAKFLRIRFLQNTSGRLLLYTVFR